MRDVVISIVERYVSSRYTRSGDSNIMMPCPLHSTKDGTPFSVNVDTGLFHCFSCGESGHMAKLLRALQQPEHVVQAETQPLQAGLEEYRVQLARQRSTRWSSENDPFLAETIISETVIARFKTFFPYKLAQAGFNIDYLRWYEVGVDEQQHRVTWPIRDIYGHLAGVSGGALFDYQLPKYKIYQGRRNDGRHAIPGDFGPDFDSKYPEYSFSKSHYLWNYERVFPRVAYGKEEDPTVYIAEGFKAGLWLLQHGYQNTVALMGSSLSEHQEMLLKRGARRQQRYVLFLDNDAAGRRGTRKLGDVLYYQMTPGVFVARYGEQAQPDEMTADILSLAISGAIPYSEWRKETEDELGRLHEGGASPHAESQRPRW